MIKWTGTETSYKTVLKFCAGVRAYSPTKGMFPFQLRYLLKTFGLAFKVRRRATVQSLTEILTTGGACIFVYKTKAGTNHVVFMDAKVEGGFRAWNRRRKHPPFISDEDMEVILRRSIRSRQLHVYIFQGVRS